MKERVTLRITLLFKTQIGGMSEIVLKNMNLVFKSGFHGFHTYSSKRLFHNLVLLIDFHQTGVGLRGFQITRT